MTQGCGVVDQPIREFDLLGEGAARPKLSNRTLCATRSFSGSEIKTERTPVTETEIFVSVAESRSR
jgi:hypothetical protein